MWKDIVKAYFVIQILLVVIPICLVLCLFLFRFLLSAFI